MFHNSADGLKLLEIRWEPIQGLYHAPKDGDGQTTFTQPGCITAPHIDGYCLEQIMAHLEGEKIWVVWPPTEHNIRKARDFSLTAMADFEQRPSVWFENFEDPQVFLTHTGDSYFLGPSVIHACISLTVSAHFGIFSWRRSSFKLAKFHSSYLQEEWLAYKKFEREVVARRKSEDKGVADATVVRKRFAERDMEDRRISRAKETFRMWKNNWTSMDKEVWDVMLKDEPDSEMDKWYRATVKVVNKVQI